MGAGSSWRIHGPSCAGLMIMQTETCCCLQDMTALFHTSAKKSSSCPGCPTHLTASTIFFSGHCPKETLLALISGGLYRKCCSQCCSMQKEGQQRQLFQ